MTLSKGYDPHLAVGETTVTGRDVEMLRAIDEHGSMHAAAEALGRSYPHLQRRVVELEDAVGELTRRARGGEGGGGTELTADARELIRQFERLQTELSGVTTVPEVVFEGEVRDQRGQLATVRTAAGDVTARVPPGADEVEIAIRADAVVLMAPGSTAHRQTSLRNQLSGSVSDLVVDDRLATVTVDVGEGVAIKSTVTESSVDSLGLEDGTAVIAAFKATAARAIAAEPS